MKKSRSAITPALWKADSPPFDWLTVCPRNDSFTATTVGTMKHGSTFPANPIFVYLAKGPKAWVNNKRRQILQLHSKEFIKGFHSLPKARCIGAGYYHLPPGYYAFLTYLPKPHVTKRSSLHKPQWQAKRRKKTKWISSRILKTYSSSPCAKHRHQAATDAATKQ